MEKKNRNRSGQDIMTRTLLSTTKNHKNHEEYTASCKICKENKVKRH